MQINLQKNATITHKKVASCGAYTDFKVAFLPAQALRFLCAYRSLYASIYAPLAH